MHPSKCKNGCLYCIRQTVEKASFCAQTKSRLQDCNRIRRLCRRGGDFSVAKYNFAEEKVTRKLDKVAYATLSTRKRMLILHPHSKCCVSSLERPGDGPFLLLDRSLQQELVDRRDARKISGELVRQARGKEQVKVRALRIEADVTPL